MKRATLVCRTLYTKIWGQKSGFLKHDGLEVAEVEVDLNETMQIDGIAVQLAKNYSVDVASRSSIVPKVKSGRRAE